MFGKWRKLLAIGVLCFSCTIARSEEPTSAAILKAFANTSQGFSSDEMLIRDDLRSAFLDEFSGPIEDAQQREIMLSLLRLRKSGKLLPKATKRGPTTESWVGPIAEIASRVVCDRHKVTTDTILADPKLRKELHAEADKIRPDIDAYALRKAVLQLRKKRALKPELVLRVAQWDREILTHSLADLQNALTNGKVSSNPGVYLFRNAKGYLYVGEAENLAKRLQQHIGGSDRKTLADYLASENAKDVSVELHVFPAKSPASKVSVRRAYESELIRSRQPKFNLRP